MNSNKEEGMTNEISLKDLKNIKHRNNFYVGVMNHVSSPCLFMCSNKTSLELQTVLFLFFKNPSSQIGGAAYLRVRLIHGRLRYFTSSFSRRACAIERVYHHGDLESYTRR